LVNRSELTRPVKRSLGVEERGRIGVGEIGVIRTVVTI
jgi:hypothetical protein